MNEPTPWVTSHELAQHFSIQAADALRRGAPEDAQKLFSIAADHESNALCETAPDKPRTRGIIAVSYVSLLFKAGRHEDAVREIDRLLCDDSLLLPPGPASQIQGLYLSLKALGHNEP